MPSARTSVILGRFPRHIEADAPGKLFTLVVDSLASHLDVQTSQIGRIRRSHRIEHADEHTDLLLLAALHGLREVDFAILSQRLAAVRGLAATLADTAAPAGAVTDALAALLTHLGLPSDVFPPFPAEGSNQAPARARLAEALDDLDSYASMTDLLRRQIGGTIDLHRHGNGTIGALLGGAANSLDLDLEVLRHTADNYWHLARCRDRLRLRRPEPPGITPPVTTPLPAADLLVLEENPFQEKRLEPVERKHTERFGLVRTGFDPAITALRIVGIGEHTVHPMVVNIDTGYGVAFHGAVPDGKELFFATDGSVTLDGADANGLAWAFQGAVFADGSVPPRARDFRFADGTAATSGDAEFAVTFPTSDAFDPAFAWPHPPGPITPHTLDISETRFAFFVRAGHFGTVEGSAAIAAIPITMAGIFDESIYQPEASAPVGKVGFTWDEREAFAVQLWIPSRFASLDAEGQVPVRERVRVALDRHRALGVHVYVGYVDDQWLLPEGVLDDLESAELPDALIHGTRLWPDGTPQPS